VFMIQLVVATVPARFWPWYRRKTEPEPLARGITRNRSRHRAAAFATRYAATELSDPTRCNPFPNRTMATAHIGEDRFNPSDKNLSANHGSNFRLDSRRYQFA
jgi:hypothetical protein